MADNNELQAARLNGAIDQGPDFVTKWAQLEETLRTVFGIEADTAYSEAMDIGTGGNITMTGSLTLPATTPTADLQAATRSYLQSQGSGMGVIRARAYLTSDIVIDPEPFQVWVPWDAADINEGNMWNALNPSRFTVPAGEGGHYIVGGSMSADAISGETRFWHRIYKNRDNDTREELCYEEHDSTVEEPSSGIALFANVEAGDYFETYIFARTSASQDTHVYAANTTMFAFKVG